MSYTKHEWITNEVISADELNAIEAGIEDAHDLVPIHASDLSTHGVTGEILGTEDIDDSICGLNAEGGIELYASGDSQIILWTNAGHTQGGSVHTYDYPAWQGTEILSNAHYDNATGWNRMDTGKTAFTMLLNTLDDRIQFWHVGAGANPIADEDWTEMGWFDKNGNFEIIGELSANNIDGGTA